MGISFHLRTESLNHAHGFVRYWGEIAALREELGADDDVLLDPLHFLAGTADNRRPRCVLGWNAIKLIGLMYVTEQYFSGFGCGYAVGGDYAGRGLLLCHPEHEAAVVQASIEHLTHNGIHSLHLRLSPRDNAKAEAEGMRIVFLD